MAWCSQAPAVHARLPRCCMRSTGPRAKSCGAAGKRLRRTCRVEGSRAAGASCILVPWTGLGMPLGSGLSIRAGASIFVALGIAWAQLPDGAGKAETGKICSQCHDLARSISLRQDRAGWQTTMDKMATLGAQGSEKEFKAVVDYLASNYPAGEIARINVNTCRAIDLESGLSLRRSQAAAVIEYRAK